MRRLLCRIRRRHSWISVWHPSVGSVTYAYVTCSTCRTPGWVS